MTTLNKGSKKLIVYFTALSGALGTSLQNFMAFVAFLGQTSNISAFFIKLLSGVVSVSSGLVNLCMNIDLLWSFAQRLSGEKKSYPGKGWQRFKYYAGSAVFITTGLLFAFTTIAFSPVGALATLGLVAGVFVGLIMMIQELETWISSFTEDQEEMSFIEGLSSWWTELTLGKSVGFIISLGNVFALSLLLTAGLTVFLMSVGVPGLTAVMAGFAVAFTVGAFTEFYFYNAFLSKFCDKFVEKCKELMASDYALLGITSIFINAAVNAALCYAGVFMLSGLVLSAGLAFPPQGMAIVAACFGGLASLLLGSSFWIDNSKHIFGLLVGNVGDTAPLIESHQKLSLALCQGDSNIVKLEQNPTCNEASYSSLWLKEEDSKPCQQSVYSVCNP